MHNMTIHFAYTTIFTKCNRLLFMKLHCKFTFYSGVYISLFFSHMYGISWVECCCSCESTYATASNNLRIPSIPDWTNDNYNSQHPWSDCGLCWSIYVYWILYIQASLFRTLHLLLSLLFLLQTKQLQGV